MVSQGRDVPEGQGPNMADAGVVIQCPRQGLGQSSGPETLPACPPPCPALTSVVSPWGVPRQREEAQSTDLALNWDSHMVVQGALRTCYVPPLAEHTPGQLRLGPAGTLVLLIAAAILPLFQVRTESVQQTDVTRSG